MLEHMGDAGLALRVVDRTSVHVSVKGYDGRFMPFADDKVKSVGQSEFGDLLFELFWALRTYD
jgi:hypothetical protein